MSRTPQLPGAGARTPHKYSAKPTWVDGIRFASKREAERYQDLRTLERGGRITGLELQPRYKLVVNGIKVASYTADFLYYEDDKMVVEDVKGMRTRDYIIKRNLMLAVHGIRVKET